MHMRRNWRGGVLLSLIFTGLLAGCSSGGGGDDAPAAAITGSAEGFWTGTTGDGRTVMGAVLDDDTYWFVYSLPGQPSEMAGMFQGHGLSRNGAFTSSDGVDFNVHALDPGSGGWASVTGSYMPQQTLNGRLAYFDQFGSPAGTATFTSTYLPAYEEAPDLAQIVGAYTGLGSVGSSPNPGTMMFITPSGDVCFAARVLVDFSRCQVTDYIGTISPRTQGNLYDMVLIHKHGPRISLNPDVYLETTIYTGVAIFDSATNRLHGLAVDPDRLTALTPTAFLFVGTKQ